MSQQWTSTTREIYHNNRQCRTGNNIEPEHYAEYIGGGKALCNECERLNSAGAGQPVIGLALSGGGAKGDFQVGAIRYLYGLGIVPHVIIGTSVGSINAAKLAEAGNGVAATRALAELENIWLSLQSNSDLYSEQEWFRNAQQDLRLLVQAGANLEQSLPDYNPAIVLLDPLQIAVDYLIAGGRCLALAKEAKRVLGNEKSLFTLQPIEQRLHGIWSPWTRLGQPNDKGHTLQAVQNADGRLEAFAVGTADDFWHCWQQNPGGNWSPWTRLGQPNDKGHTLQAVQNADGRLEAFAVGTADDFWHCWQQNPGGNWSPWTRLGQPNDKGHTLQAVQNADGRLEAFAVGTADDFWHCWQQNPGGNWSPWTRLGQPNDKGHTLQAVQNADGRLEAFAVGTADDFWHCWQQNPGGNWSPWTRLGQPNDKGHTLQAVQNADGRLEAFAVGTADDFWHCWQQNPGGNWSPWTRLGQPNDKGHTLQAVQNADGRLEAFAVDINEHLIYSVQRADADQWTDWARIGAMSDRGRLISAARDFDDTITLFMLGTRSDFWMTTSISYLSPKAISKSGTELRLTVVQLESGMLRQVNQLGQFLDSPNERPVSLPEAVIASASIPVAFPPVVINGNSYVDGGVREILPLQAAIDAGATVIYAINCSPKTISAPSFKSRSLSEIGARALDLALDEIATDDARHPEANRFGREVYLIQPRVPVHDTLTIDPGLIDISIAYGYMEAADKCSPIRDPRSAADLLDDIIKNRIHSWTLEHYANGESLPAESLNGPLRQARDAQALLEVRRLKKELKKLLEKRVETGGAVPPGIQSWWLNWERHPWITFTDNPWSYYVDSAGSPVPAEAQP